ncbi:cytochrome P450 [Perilla frutescens var. hirtella]|uniref:Cytochrome P450 n=1 Tax=Perilla frutescens var. hirtella TaxID=608512 RepID=A0AAD4PC93_PERFH|nr:cytochrome P450 [Perilla frutescens var. hirtella]
MDVFICSVILCAVLVSICGWKILNWLWFRPRMLEKSLRQQGFTGNSYRLFYGDLKDMRRKSKEALSKPINFSHDIVHRVIPSIHIALNNYGNNCFVWFGPRPALVVLDPEIVREIVSKTYVFQKPPGRPFIRLLARGLASLETDKWAKHRRLINPAFHVEKLKHMVPSFYLSCADMLSKWDKIVPSDGSCEVDVWPYLQTLTSDVISRTAFGSSYEEGTKIFQLQKEVAQHVVEASRSVYIPGFRFLPTKVNLRIKEIRKEVKSSLLNIISRRMKAMEAGEVTRGDLLGLLLESNSEEIKQKGSKFGMSMNEVIEECKLFYFAGHETTASLLVWTMILLSKHTDWQVRARDEVLQVFGRRKPDDHQELNHLKIISMILHEVLRLYPPAILLTRATHKECEIGKVSLPAGVQLILPPILLQRDCKIWGDDAGEFEPERFKEGVSKATRGQLAYFPFGWGPRICIAQNFAMLEAKMAMVMILQHYSFQLSPSYSHAPHHVVALQPQHGAHLILSKL